MKRTVIGVIIGSVFGGISLFPPSIPLYLTLSWDRLHYSETNEVVFWLLPLVGLILGGVVGGLIGKYRTSLLPFKNKAFSVFFSLIFTFWFLGLEVGFVLSPITMIGLGNISTAIDLWTFPVLLSIAGIISGSIVLLIVLLIVLAVYLPMKRIFDYIKSMNNSTRSTLG